MLSITDTHLHLWDLEQISLPWLDGIDVLNRNHLLEEYFQITKKHHVNQLIYMEVDVADEFKLKEADYIQRLSENPENQIKAAVFSAVLTNPNFDRILETYGKYPLIRGIRQVLHTPQYEKGHCLTDGFLKSLSKIIEAGLLFDVCIRPAELDDAVKLADRFPEGTFVLDHCGNPNPLLIAGKIPETEKDSNNPFWHHRQDWLDQISALGKRKNVICKISGIIARADPNNFSPEDLRPVVEHCLDCFGEDRVIFGGDWPICNLALGLDIWIQALKEIVGNKSESLQKKLFSENTARIYRL